MWLKWFPWRYIVRRVACAHGFIDPINVLSYLHRFAEPSEVAEPIELLRAGVVFHARGLMNTRAIQHNLDWVWPYWVERQFDPNDPSFIPRAFSITHVNLTHRNWTAVGLRDCEEFSIVDPRGLLTPFYDSWSLDAWFIPHEGSPVYPSRMTDGVEQELLLQDPPAVVTCITAEPCELTLTASVLHADTSSTIKLDTKVKAKVAGKLVISIRPYNPEGVSFIHSIAIAEQTAQVQINKEHALRFIPAPERWVTADYRVGDVAQHLAETPQSNEIVCPVGMATVAALYQVDSGEVQETAVEIAVPQKQALITAQQRIRGEALRDENSPVTLTIPDKKYEFLFKAAVETLVLFSPCTGEIVPGPYTYRRFWFRDAVFMLHALACCGYLRRTKNAIDQFPRRQSYSGYFLSQEGEWDSNGQVLWMMHRFCELTASSPPSAWIEPLRKGGQWIINKRVTDTDSSVNGLLPAGFSAEHLGTNDYYYWDNFWAVAGLRAAESLFGLAGLKDEAEDLTFHRRDYEKVVERSIKNCRHRQRFSGIPASPFRRMDAGAIGSLVTAYPLALSEPRDPLVLATVEFLLEHCFLKDGFFQDMIHSGVNPYLTLHVAQVLLRAGDIRFQSLVRRVAELASPTGQWPEAIHPHTGGGCMGDGQHGWAAAEWVMIVRNMFVREEQDQLLLCSGIPREWLGGSTAIHFGPTATRFGPVSVTIEPTAQGVRLGLDVNWSEIPREILVNLGLSTPRSITHDTREVSFNWSELR